MIEIISAIGTITLLIGLFYLNRKKVRGQWLMLVTCMLFLSVNIQLNLFFMSVKDLLCGILAIEGIRKWSK